MFLDEASASIADCKIKIVLTNKTKLNVYNMSAKTFVLRKRPIHRLKQEVKPDFSPNTIWDASLLLSISGYFVCGYSVIERYRIYCFAWSRCSMQHQVYFNLKFPLPSFCSKIPWLLTEISWDNVTVFSEFQRHHNDATSRFYLTFLSVR